MALSSSRTWAALPDRVISTRLAERGSSDHGSDARQLHTGQFTDSIGFQAELVELAWQGPLPPPGQLAEYEKIVPGAAARILAMAEVAISGPIQNTAKLTDAEIEASKRGLTFSPWWAPEVLRLALQPDLYAYLYP